MPESEGLGRTGWLALGILILGIALVVIFGFDAAIYIGLLGTAVSMVLMVWLCLDIPDKPGEPRPDPEDIEPLGGR